MNGYIKLYRKLLENKIFDNEKLLKVWVWCLLKATYKEHDQLVGLQTVHLMPGQFIFGRFKNAEELKINPNTLKKYMEFLSSERLISIKSTNKFSVVTVVNWELYQSEEENNTNKIPTKYQQNTTNKKVKKEKNNTPLTPHKEILEIFHSLCPSLPKIKQLTDNRIKHLNARWGECESIEQFRQLFIKAEKSDFLSGRRPNDRNWRCDFDWLINQQNMAKVLEGKYDNAGDADKSPPKVVIR